MTEITPTPPQKRQKLETKTYTPNVFSESRAMFESNLPGFMDKSSASKFASTSQTSQVIVKKHLADLQKEYQELDAEIDSIVIQNNKIFEFLLNERKYNELDNVLKNERENLLKKLLLSQLNTGPLLVKYYRNVKENNSLKHIGVVAKNRFWKHASVDKWKAILRAFGPPRVRSDEYTMNSRANREFEIQLTIDFFTAVLDSDLSQHEKDELILPSINTLLSTDATKYAWNMHQFDILMGRILSESKQAKTEAEHIYHVEKATLQKLVDERLDKISQLANETDNEKIQEMLNNLAEFQTDITFQANRVGYFERKLYFK